MSKKITRRDIVRCSWSWSSVGKAVAYRTALGFLRGSGADESSIKAIRTMMRYHATDAIREARLFTPAR